MRTASVLLSALALANAAWAAPVNLECTSKSSGIDFTLRADETSGKVTHSEDTGATFNTDGFFKADALLWRVVKSSAVGRRTYEYEIDRTSLALPGGV